MPSCSKGIRGNRESDATALALRAVYRQSMLRLGRNTNTPIEAVSFAELTKEEKTPEARFLLSCKRLYRRLVPIERKTVVNEIFERGLHYQFWYIHAIPEREYRKLKKRMNEEVYALASKEGLL
ncbi:MAG: hypothetical protein SPG64_04520 [Candidatus Enteromonas sp.]|nr:hypothetical protein [Candidatus Enteromonas sp.]